MCCIDRLKSQPKTDIHSSVDRCLATPHRFNRSNALLVPVVSDAVTRLVRVSGLGYLSLDFVPASRW